MKIKYYYSVASPFSYLAIDRFIDLVNKKNVEVEELPFDLVGQVFPNTGGVPVPKRHPSRLKYRLIEIERIGKKYGVEINVQPKFFPPSDPHLPARFTIAAIELGNKLTFGKECLKYLWSKEKDISDLKILEEICNNLQLSFSKIEELANSEKVKKIYSDNSNNAIKEDVFGAPTYIYNDELYWGQDRLEYLEDNIQ
jgi:2-hydroxychromene-2-carboxylate isomerase